MTYIRKRSIALKRLASRRLLQTRAKLRKLELSLTIEVNFLFLKISLTLKSRECSALAPEHRAAFHDAMRVLIKTQWPRP